MLLEKDGRKLGIHMVGLLAGFLDKQAAIVDDREWVEENTVQECVEHTLRKDQKITKNTKNICLKDKKEKKQINNAGFW